MYSFVKFFRASQGATAIEYALIAALISVAAISAIQAVGTGVTGTFNNASAKL